MCSDCSSVLRGCETFFATDFFAGFDVPFNRVAEDFGAVFACIVVPCQPINSFCQCGRDACRDDNRGRPWTLPSLVLCRHHDKINLVYTVYGCQSCPTLLGVT